MYIRKLSPVTIFSASPLRKVVSVRDYQAAMKGQLNPAVLKNTPGVYELVCSSSDGMTRAPIIVELLRCMPEDEVQRIALSLFESDIPDADLTSYPDRVQECVQAMKKGS